MKRATGKTGSQSSAQHSTVEHLFVVRESAEYDHMLFEQMVHQILDKRTDLPGVKEILLLGAKPLLPDSVELRAALTAQPLISSTGRVFGYLFDKDGTWFLYAMSSAAKQNSEGLNDFTLALANAIKSLRPKNLYTGPASRLIRNKYHGATISKAALEASTVLHTAEVPNGLNLEDAGHSLTWDLLAMMAHSEYKIILDRMLTGTVMNIKAGFWPRSDNTIPLGYKKDKNGKIALDEKEEALVRELIVLAADPEVTDKSIRNFLNENKVFQVAKTASWEDITMHATRRHLSRLKIYEGTWLYRHACHVTTDTFHGMQVEHEEEKHTLLLPIALPLPKTPWATPETLQRAVLLRSRSSNADSASNASIVSSAGKLSVSSVLPLTTLPVSAPVEGDVVLRAEDGSYVLRARPEDTTGPWTPGTSSLLARFNPEQLHLAISDSITQSLEKGILALLPQYLIKPTQEVSVFELEESLRVSEMLRDGYDRSAAVSPERDSLRYRRLATLETDKIEELQSAILVANSFTKDALQLPVGEFGSLAALLSALALAETPQALGNAVSQVFTGLTFTSLSLSDPVVSFEISFRVFSPNGFLTLGPVEVKVRSDASRSSTVLERSDSLLRRVALGESLTDLAKQLSTKPELLQRSIQENSSFTATKARIIITCPILSTRKAMWEALTGEDVKAEKEMVAHLKAVFQNFLWEGNWLRKESVTAALLLKEVEAGPLSYREVKEKLRWSDPKMGKYLKTGGYSPPTNTRPLSAACSSVGGGRGGALRTLQAFSCPHCNNSLTCYLSVPEITGDLLCAVCLRTPGADVVFSKEYLQL